MSESFQEFCKRLLPAVKEAAESGVFVFPSGIFGSVGANGDCVCLWANSSVLSKREPEATPLPITPEMWAMIDPRYQWAFLSDDGKSVVCENEPRWVDGMGVAHSTWLVYGGLSKLPLNIDTTGIIPELSLTKRPEPPEFTVNVERLKTAAEMLK